MQGPKTQSQNEDCFLLDEIYTDPWQKMHPALNTMPIQFSHLVRAYEFRALVLLVVLQCYEVPIYRINVPILYIAVCAAIKKKETVQI